MLIYQNSFNYSTTNYKLNTAKEPKIGFIYGAYYVDLSISFII